MCGIVLDDKNEIKLEFILFLNFRAGIFLPIRQIYIFEQALSDVLNSDNSGIRSLTEYNINCVWQKRFAFQTVQQFDLTFVNFRII